MRTDTGCSWLARLAVAMAACGVMAVAGAAEPFALKSLSFKDGTLLPKKAANASKNMPNGNPNCVGENSSPQLSWTNAPEGTKSFAIVMTDPEGRGGLGVIHWLAYGIAATVKGFAAGEASMDSDKFVGGKSTMGVGHYSGPCTPPGAPHHYTFVLIATDLEPSDLPPGLSLPELQAKLAGHTKGAAGLIGLFKNPY